MKRSMPWILTIVGLWLVGLSGSAFGPTPALAAPAEAPRLVLLVAVDQMRYDYLPRFADAFTGGFRRLMSDGAVFTNAHLDHYPTVTAVGHATMLTGAPPAMSGIVGNDWYDRGAEEGRHERRRPGDEARRRTGRHRLLAASPPGEHGRGRAEDGSPRLSRDRHRAQGPERDPDGGPDGRPRPLVGHADGGLRLEHLVRAGAAGVGGRLQREEARRRLAGPRVAGGRRGRRAARPHAGHAGARLLRAGSTAARSATISSSRSRRPCSRESAWARGAGRTSSR